MLKITEAITSISEVSQALHDVTRVNSIKKLFKRQRQESKVPTFALTYDGTYITLMRTMGINKKAAKSIEKSYHDMYSVSDKWVAAKIQQASIDGYITIAFGLRLRTPLLKQVILGTSKTPYEAASEGRTAGNALGQSWCMLNSRAGSEFLEIVRKGKYRLCIKPCAQIHDAGYFLIQDSMDVLRYTNKHLVKAVSWQEDPQIQNEHVLMSGTLEVYWPTWGQGMSIPNGASEDEIKAVIVKHKESLNG